jgi:LAO/AO transport system kinase
MASRGTLGGLARETRHVVRVLDACGYQRILVETVGAGQAEVDIARTAQTTLVLQVPGMGDDVQTMKAGILEIADILVVNKADLMGARRTVRQLEAMLCLGHAQARQDAPGAWCPPILETVATSGSGVAELVDAIETHATYADEAECVRLRERARVRDELEGILRDELLARSLDRLGEALVQEAVDRVHRRELDPYTAADQLLERATGDGTPPRENAGMLRRGGDLAR